MRTSYRAQKRLLLSAGLWCFAASLGAQTLARSHWNGSGFSVEPWWRSAVFYRIAPENFQDSDGDGVGDLGGVAQRLDYLQSLNVDAVVLQAPFDDKGFDDLVSAASRRHIRLLVELPSSGGDATLPKARQWLTRGAAGIWLHVGHDESADRTAALVHSLRSLTDGVPGQRILVEDTTSNTAITPAPGAQLVVRPVPSDIGNPAAFRTALTQAQTVPQGSFPLLSLAGVETTGFEADPHKLLQEKALAMALLVSRAAVAMTYGQEIGLTSAASGSHPIMWWTPANITKPPAPPDPPEPPKPVTPPREDVYGAYVPYAPPKPKKPTNTPPDPNELPGFTNGTLPPKASAPSASMNVALEDSDKESLLNLYRKLSQFHHSDPAVHTGTSLVLDHDAQNILVWVLREPAGGRNVTAVVAACNLSDQRANFSLHADVERMKLRGGPLRVAITTSPSNIQADQITDAATLAPWSLMLVYLDR